jgi:gas vesicle protein
MIRRRKNSSRKWAIGTLIAGLAGYLTGVLTAPQSGKDTREDIVGKAKDMKADSEEQLQATKDEVSELLKNAKDKTLALSAKARIEYDEAVVAAKDAVNKGSSVLKAVKAGEAADPELNKAIKQLKQAQKNLSKYLKNK